MLFSSSTKKTITGSVNLNTKKATACGVFRNHLGIVLYCFVVDLGFCSINYAELWVIYICIDLAWSWGFKRSSLLNLTLK